MINASELQTEALFAQYIDVVNQSLGQNRDRFPYKQMIGAGERIFGDKEIGVSVYRDEPGRPEDYFTIKLSGGTFAVVGHGKKSPSVEWNVNRRHLENVVEEPRPYIDSPVKLDLDWLKTRAGIGH